MKSKEVFDSLARNAFDFLERAITEFDKDPKYSVIHFCAAVEMLLKARLMCEHWSLIVAKPEQASLNKFIAGDFVSVSMSETISRLHNIAGEEIENKAISTFDALAKHRNKMIHFFHAELERDKNAKDKIVAEHCLSWFHLHRLLGRWNSQFNDFDKEISRADKSMKKHRGYLKAKFEALKNELEEARKQGDKPKTCSSCGFKAALPEAIDQDIEIARCLVCEHVETRVNVECPHCNKKIVVAGYGHTNCPRCNGSIEPKDLVECLIDQGAAHIAAKEGDSSWDPANCTSCDGYHTVVRRDDFHFCTDCFECFDHVAHCGWCNEANTGDMEDSYLYGCSHCDGRVGQERDD